MALTHAWLGLLLQTQTAEFRFPVEPIGPQAVALGGAGVAMTREAEATLNPATLLGAPRLSLHRYEGFAGYGGFVLAGNTRAFPWLAFGLGLRHFDYGKIVEDDLGPGTTALNAAEQVFELTGAVRLPDGIQAGLSVGYLSADYFGSVTSATALSAGAAYSPARGGTVGVALRTAGAAARNHDSDARYPLATRVRIGAAQRIEVAGQSLTLAADFERGVRRSHAINSHIGVEWQVWSRGLAHRLRTPCEYRCGGTVGFPLVWRFWSDCGTNRARAGCEIRGRSWRRRALPRYRCFSIVGARRPGCDGHHETSGPSSGCVAPAPAL